MLALKDRITLVTGSSRGIGKAIALALAEAGTDVAVNYHKQATAAESVAAEIKKLGRRCITVQADVSESAQVDRLFTDVEKTLGSVDVLVNNAGIATALSPSQVAEADWHETIRVNLTSVFLVTQRALPAMRAKRWAASSMFLPLQRSTAASSARTTPHPKQESSASHALMLTSLPKRESPSTPSLQR